MNDDIIYIILASICACMHEVMHALFNDLLGHRGCFGLLN